MTLPKGRFITFEGGEGAGKSTQARLLANRLKEQNIPMIPTREPGGSKGAETIRQLLVTGTKDRWSPICEALLMYAARADHWQRCIQPALQKGEWVICDRFADSSIAYQGYGHGTDLTHLNAFYEDMAHFKRPDRTYIFDVDPEVGLERAHRRRHDENRFESFDLEFHQRVRQGFLDIANQYPQRCLVIKANEPVDVIQEKIWQDVTKLFF